MLLRSNKANTNYMAVINYGELIPNKLLAKKLIYKILQTMLARMQLLFHEEN